MSAIHEITEDWQREGLSPTWVKLQQAKAEHDALVAKCEELAKVVAKKAELLRGCYAADNRQKQQIKKLTEALSFYADPLRYFGPNQRAKPGDKWTLPDAPYMQDVGRDSGNIARAALKEDKTC